jgi:hypothetical protein
LEIVFKKNLEEFGEAVYTTGMQTVKTGLMKFLMGIRTLRN